jgi:class 3 adenylate cyclase/tetratricopeptide (TPR) repeat protein
MRSTVTVTILFTDWVDSTALASQLGPEAAEELRQTHYALLRAEVATAEGTEIKSTGDGVMVAFGSVSAALDCAVAMQQAIDRHNRAAKEPLAVRIGVSHGDAELGDDGDYYGPQVVEAARLCATAGGGQILVTELVRLLAGGRGTHDFVTLGPLDLKGLPEAVVAHEVRWEPAHDARLPLPPALAAEGPVDFIGRSGELARLERAWKDAVGGQRRVVFVTGEPGIGKTRLVAELGRRVHTEGATVLYGSSDEDLGVPYRPWLDALGQLLDQARDEVLDAVAPIRFADLGRVVPQAAGRAGGAPPTPATDPETERYLFFSAVVELLGAAAAATPVLLVLDDLQWADAPTLQLLRFVVVAPESSHLLIAGTYRDSELGATSPLTDAVAKLHRVAGVEELGLPGLDDRDIVAMMEAAAGHEMNNAGLAMAHTLYRETDGNPFFTWELMRHLSETGAVAQEPSGTWVARQDMDELSLPKSIRAVIGQRLGRLGDDAQRVLEFAAVSGREFELGIVAAALDADVDGVLECLESAQAAGLIANLAGERFSFSHALVARTIYADLTPARRARAHRQLAQTIESLGLADTRVVELARHWTAAVSPADAEKALEYVRRAGDEALAALAPDEAARSYCQSLELLAQLPSPHESLRCELLVCLGDAQRQAGDPAFRETAMEAARLAESLGDTDRLVRAALIDYERGYPASRDADRVAMLEAALAALPDGDSTARARLLTKLSYECTFTDPARASVLGTNAYDMARRLGDPSTLVDATTRAARTWRVAMNIPAAHPFYWDRPVLDEATATAEQLGDPAVLFTALYVGIQIEIQTGNLAGANRRLDRVVALAEEVGQPDLRWIATYLCADLALLAGDAAGAERLVEAAYAIGRETGQRGAGTIYAAGMQSVRWHQGRQAEVAGLLAEAAAADPDLGVLQVGVEVPGEQSSSAGGAAAELAAAVARAPEDASWDLSMTIFAELAGRRRDAEAAATLYDRLMPFNGMFAYATAILRGPIAHYLGMLAAVLQRYDDGDQHFARAAELNERLQAPFHLARTQLEWARMLHERTNPGDRDRAKELLERARSTAALYGCAQVERRANRLLQEI